MGRPEPAPFRADEHAVELVLLETDPPRTPRTGAESEASPLHVDGALLLSGVVASTVLTIDTPGRGLVVRIRALPVTVTPTARLRPVRLRIAVRDCEVASRWTPADRPFTITWRDEYDQEHTDRAGDFGMAMAVSLKRYVEAVCDGPADR